MIHLIKRLFPDVNLPKYTMNAFCLLCVFSSISVPSSLSAEGGNSSLAPTWFQNHVSRRVSPPLPRYQTTPALTLCQGVRVLSDGAHAYLFSNSGL